MLTLLSWNINGIRSFKCSAKETLASLDANVICFQETKITRDMLDAQTALVDGYNSYYSFSKKRAGYSGVATYCKESCTPVKAEEGISGALSHLIAPDGFNYCLGSIREEFSDVEIKDLDTEGRCVITEHTVKDENDVVSNLIIINVYCPRADPENEDRLNFKLRFYRLMELRCQAFIQCGKHVVILGDINTSHQRIDNCNPDDDFEKSPSRIWLSRFLITAENPEGIMVDSFRYLYPSSARSYTCWNTLLSARSNNYGTRIDYIFISPSLLLFLNDSECLPDIQGSDHCPIRASFKLTPITSPKCPSFCTKYYKEFAGKQSTIASFLFKQTINNVDSSYSSLEGLEGPSAAKKPRMQETKKIYNYFQKTSNSEVKAVSSGIETSSINSRTSETDTEQEFITCTGSVVLNSQAAQAWKSLLKGPSSPPLCKGHSEPCVLRTVKKKGPNMNRQFWVCHRGEGHKNDPAAKCDFFQWLQRK